MISIKKAKEISIAKWESELLNTEAEETLQNFKQEYPTLAMHHSCGFCLRHGFSLDQHGSRDYCEKCELANSPAKDCLHPDSLYNVIEDLEGFEKQDAIRELLEIIKDIPEEDE
jgi:hypothetical protein